MYLDPCTHLKGTERRQIVCDEYQRQARMHMMPYISHCIGQRGTLCYKQGNRGHQVGRRGLGQKVKGSAAQVQCTEQKSSHHCLGEAGKPRQVHVPVISHCRSLDQDPRKYLY